MGRVDFRSLQGNLCGDITHLLPSLSEINLDILDIDYQVDPDYARTFMDSHVAVCGNINPVTIQDSLPEQIAEITSTLVKSQHGKKFILSGGCKITVDTPHQNLEAMKRALDEQKHYL